MLLVLSAAFATEITGPDGHLATEAIVPIDHDYIGGLVDQRGACEDPEALTEVLRRLAIEDARALQDFEVGDPALPFRPLTLDVQSADVHQIFRLMAKLGDTNIVLADGVDGEVTMRLVDTPWDEVLEVVLVSAHLDAKVGDNLIVVYPL